MWPCSTSLLRSYNASLRRPTSCYKATSTVAHVPPKLTIESCCQSEIGPRSPSRLPLQAYAHNSNLLLGCLHVFTEKGKVNTRASRQIPRLRNSQIRVFNGKGNLSTRASRQTPRLRIWHTRSICQSWCPVKKIRTYLHTERVLLNSSPLTYAVGPTPIYWACQ